MGLILVRLCAGGWCGSFVLWPDARGPRPGIPPFEGAVWSHPPCGHAPHLARLGGASGVDIRTALVSGAFDRIGGGRGRMRASSLVRRRGRFLPEAPVSRCPWWPETPGASQRRPHAGPLRTGSDVSPSLGIGCPGYLSRWTVPSRSSPSPARVPFARAGAQRRTPDGVRRTAALRARRAPGSSSAGVRALADPLMASEGTDQGRHVSPGWFFENGARSLACSEVSLRPGRTPVPRGTLGDPIDRHPSIAHPTRTARVPRHRQARSLRSGVRRDPREIMGLALLRGSR
jgi:hypothetical protein